MDLAAIFKSASCSVNLKARNKEGVIESLAALAVRSGTTGTASEKAIAVALSEREAQGSTGFGDEIAIPHARVTGLKVFLVFIAHAPKGVDFDSLDKKKVKLFFVILGPEERPSEHVQILAAISRSLSGTTLKKELLTAGTAEIMAESFMRHSGEKHDDTPTRKQKMKLLVLILYLEEFIYHILEYFLEEGIEGATILDSSGMGQYISNIPLFATFIGFMNEQKNRSNIILATIPADREDEIIKGIEAITGDLDKKQGAMLMTLDIGVWKGTMKMM
ncbi:MAG: PTS sugar transporter subunit IIA [Spirochaetaceae bacterium]|nr:PTS sugar transporter subunit IIA [Spirochaetaceae bacterium]